MTNNDAFDYKFYLEYYTDIAGTSYEDALQHWKSYGINEGRYASADDFYKRKCIILEELPRDFDPIIYLELNPDVKRELSERGCNNNYEITAHYLNYGIQEKRRYKYLIKPPHINPTQERKLSTLMLQNSVFISSKETKELINCYLPELFTETLDNVASLSTQDDSTSIEQKHQFSNQRLNDFDKYCDSDKNRLIEIIASSGLFNLGFYIQQTGQYFGYKVAIEHYLLSGATQGLTPILNFNLDDYRSINNDLPFLTNAECFIHYLLIGRTQKRYFSKYLLKQHSAEIRTNPKFHSIWQSIPISQEHNELNCYEYYLAIDWRHKNSFGNQDFDSALYLSCYEDARESELPPLIHYLRHGKGRISNYREVNQLTHKILQSNEFDSTWYQNRYKKIIRQDVSEVLHYICCGIPLKLNPNNNFDTEYYVRKYPDILNSGFVPFIHYLEYGRDEGRSSTFNAQQHFTPGCCSFDSNKPTVLIVCHEASRTGAPILGLRLIEQLSQQANIISWNGKKGPLSRKFAESSIVMINGSFDHTDTIWLIRELKKLYSPEVAIVNSSVIANIAAALNEEKTPVVSLIHEYGDYMGPQIFSICRTANKIIFPAESVKASCDRINFIGTGRVTNMSVRHQGRCIPPSSETQKGAIYTKRGILLKLGISDEDEKPFIVLGCGWVQIRKGVEYFIEAARLCKQFLKRPVYFIWVGSGYEPDTDLMYSAWLKSQVINSELENEVIFFEETPDLTPFFQLADVFFLSSRLDPFPNVAIDAVDAGLPVVAFERGTGFAEFINAHLGIGIVVPFLDTVAAAQAICEYATGKRDMSNRDPNISGFFSFSDYADFIWNECQLAIVQQKLIDEETQFLTDSNLFDNEFFISAHPDWNGLQSPEYVYVSQWSRGIRIAKSRPGFNDNIAQALLSAQISGTGVITPLAAALKTDSPLITHNIQYSDTNNSRQVYSYTVTAALHIHAYNIENLPQLLHRLGKVTKNISLFITTDKAKKAKEINLILKKHCLTAIIEIMPNRGRDIGPFVMMMKQHLSDFEIVGHFHLKSTKELNQNIVYQWQNFLYETLLGKNGEMIEKLLCQFKQTQKLGLLFQEDPCLSGWTKNRGGAESLLNKLAIQRKLPDEIEYPMGNMFWARTAALAPLLQHDWQWSDFPAEPVPYDGSILHAIERLTPFICEEAGFEWATVHTSLAKRYSAG